MTKLTTLLSYRKIIDTMESICICQKIMRHMGLSTVNNGNLVFILFVHTYCIQHQLLILQMVILFFLCKYSINKVKRIYLINSLTTVPSWCSYTSTSCRYTSKNHRNVSQIRQHNVSNTSGHYQNRLL